MLTRQPPGELRDMRERRAEPPAEPEDELDESA
jgi:hypothetical protein